MPVALDDDRFTVPLYTVTQASRYLQLPRATLGTWTDGYERHGGEGYGVRSTAAQPVVTALPRRRRGHPRLPFVGIAEAYVPAFPSGRRTDAAHPSISGVAA